MKPTICAHDRDKRFCAECLIPIAPEPVVPKPEAARLSAPLGWQLNQNMEGVYVCGLCGGEFPVKGQPMRFQRVKHECVA